MQSNSYGNTKSAIWLTKYAGDQQKVVSRLISSINENSNFLRFLHENVKNNSLISPYRKQVNRMVQDEYLFWKGEIREQLRGRVSDVTIAYLRQRFNNFFKD